MKPDPGVEEIRARVEVLFTGMQHPELLTACGVQTDPPVKFLLPYELNEILAGHHCFMR